METGTLGYESAGKSGLHIFLSETQPSGTRVNLAIACSAVSRVKTRVYARPCIWQLTVQCHDNAFLVIDTSDAQSAVIYAKKRGVLQHPYRLEASAIFFQ
ncbi:hypothetical protein AAHE18_01G003800 [Arachis hypogaea]